MAKNEKSNDPVSLMASEPAAIYYGTSEQLRELDSLGSMIKSTGKASEQLIAEYVKDKFVEKYMNV